MAKGYHFNNIRTLFNEGFDDEELRRLCFDIPDFRPVYNQLTHNTGKAQIVDLLIEHADKKLQIEVLLNLARERNPARYEKHQPYYGTQRKSQRTQNFDEFCKIEKYRDTQVKRDALRSILGDVIPDMQAVLNRAVFEPREALKTEIRTLHKRIEVIRPLFHNNEKVQRTLTGLGNLVGSVVSPYLQITKQVFDEFYSDVQILKDELVTLENTLSGELSKPD